MKPATKSDPSLWVWFVAYGQCEHFCLGRHQDTATIKRAIRDISANGFWLSPEIIFIPPSSITQFAIWPQAECKLGNCTEAAFQPLEHVG